MNSIEEKIIKTHGLIKIMMREDHMIIPEEV